jgi:hypothetical protein
MGLVMKDAFGVSKAISAKGAKALSAYSGPARVGGKRLRLKNANRPRGLLGPGQNIKSVNVNSDGTAVKWAKGKPADWV